MIGDARNTDEPSLLAAALDGAAVRVKGLVYQLQGRLQARFNLAWPAQPTAFAGTPVIPTVRYRDVPAAIAWLCRAFGMKVHRVETDSSGAPCYAELTIGSGMLMVAPIEDTVFGRLLVQPDEIGGVETQVCYLCVTNARAHHARAKAAGAVIVIDPDHEANKGRGYSCRDPEGHVWNFGTYDPWEKRQRPTVHPAQAWGLRRLQQGLAAAVLLVLASGLLFEVAPQPSARASTSVPEPPANASVAASLGAPPLASEPLQDAGEAVPREAAARREAEAHKRALEAADRAAAEARAQLAEARGAIESAAQSAKKAERDATAARLQLDEMQRAKQAAERAAAQAREHLAAAQQSAERARMEAALERAKRIAADRAAIRARKRASVSPALPRPRWARSWCYSPGIPNPASNGAARLVGFCKG